MSTQSKIKIKDCSEIRSEIDKEYEYANQVVLAKWAILCARHVSEFLKGESIDQTEIEKAIRINELWQNGKATVHEVRQAGFRIHAIARQCKTELAKNAVRTSGQAVGVGHMREHAMVCSDYAIKTLELAFPDNFEKIKEERVWQLNELRRLKTS
jgi:hypothetical protein